jgi:hypothetical protein
MKVLEKHGNKRREVPITRIVVAGAGDASVNGEYIATSASEVPAGINEHA